jgi:hypothetical protein
MRVWSKQASWDIRPDMLERTTLTSKNRAGYVLRTTITFCTHRFRSSM